MFVRFTNGLLDRSQQRPYENHRYLIRELRWDFFFVFAFHLNDKGLLKNGAYNTTILVVIIDREIKIDLISINVTRFVHV